MVLFLIALTAASLGIAYAASDTFRFMISSSVDYLLYGVPSQQNRDEAELVIKAITRAHHFVRYSTSQPATPPAFAEAGSSKLLTRPMEVDIYEVHAAPDQDRIIAAVRELERVREIGPVDLRFYDHENWIVTKEGDEERGGEMLLRQVKLNGATM